MRIEIEGNKDLSTNKPMRYSLSAVRLKAYDKPKGEHSIGNTASFLKQAA